MTLVVRVGTRLDQRDPSAIDLIMHARDMGAPQRCIEIEGGRAASAVGEELPELHIRHRRLMLFQAVLGFGLALEILSAAG